MSIGPMFKIELNPAWVEEMNQLGQRLNEIMTSWRVNVPFDRLDYPPLFGPDWLAEIEQQAEAALAFRRNDAAQLTRAAHIYGFRDAKVVWLQEPGQFAFINLDGLVCADIPQIGEAYETALRWIREEAHDE